MSLQLREYQIKAVEKGLDSLKSGKNEIIVGPTGCGKSLIISSLCRELNDHTLILQPDKEILKQNYAKLQMYGIDDIAIYSASMKTKEISKYTYATIGSIKDPELFKHFKYILFDEGHKGNPRSGMYKKFFKALGKPRVLALTATPYRLVNKFFQEGGAMYYTSMLQVINRIYPPFFKSFCFKITNKSLFDEGYLAPINYISHRDIDISRVKINTTGADFDERSLEEALNLPGNVIKVVEAVISQDHLPNNLIFCSSIRHARAVSEELAKRGYDSDLVTGKDDSDTRDWKIEGFKIGKIKRLLAVGMMGIGFDFPGLYCVTLGRPTMSLTILYQQIGRVVRLDPANPNKVATVIDCCNNVKRMGRIETIRITKDPFGLDCVETERGIISGRPLFTFKVTDQSKINIFSK